MASASWAFITSRNFAMVGFIAAPVVVGTGFSQARPSGGVKSFRCADGRRPVDDGQQYEELVQAEIASRRIRRRRRRSRSDRPPQIPNRSSLARANSRHSARTSHPEQTRLASRVEPPFSGKKDSGSVSAHSASSRHPPFPAAEPPSHGIACIGSAARVKESGTRLRDGRENEDTESSSGEVGGDVTDRY